MALVTSTNENGVAILTLSHPKLNVLSQELISDLNKALDQAESDPSIKVILLAHTGKAFAAGADISEVADLTSKDFAQEDFVDAWQRINKCEKPIIAEINGFCLGGGFELALMCDMIVASSEARFGQPEITIGTLPGSGATQRLTALVGKAKAMELCLTGRILSAEEAHKWGLIHHVEDPQILHQKALELAQSITKFSQPVVKMIKSLVKSAAESHLREGLLQEREFFHQTFNLQDQKEGMRAFLERRPPQFKDC